MTQTVIVDGKRITVARTTGNHVVLSMQNTPGGTFYEWILTTNEAHSVAAMLNLAAMLPEKLAEKKGRKGK